jgi:hypothetical protein
MMRIISLLLTIPALTICACSSSTKRPAREAPPVAYQASPESTPVRLTAPPAAKVSEVQQAVKRIFKDGAVLNTDYNPSFVAGDFNGDASQDIAVVLKPVKLDVMNQELPPWLIRDPRTNKVDKTSPPKIEKDEVLLAVIHGYGANDWRDPDATQTFVLKNVVGNNLKVETGKEFVAANSGRKLPRAQGDLIGETVQGTSGYLYFAKSTYSWYDPNTFKGDEPSGVFHKSRTVR